MVVVAFRFLSLSTGPKNFLTLKFLSHFSDYSRRNNNLSFLFYAKPRINICSMNDQIKMHFFGEFDSCRMG